MGKVSFGPLSLAIESRGSDVNVDANLGVVVPSKGLEQYTKITGLSSKISISSQTLRAKVLVI